jgi:aryl-alcohol dehydrogenase-like predicted oxidoreductase
MAQQRSFLYSLYILPIYADNTDAIPKQGQFQERLPPRTVLGGTKWCVFKHGDISRATVETAVRERMTRMRTRQLDFLQVRQSDIFNFPTLKNLSFLFRP